MGRYYDGDINGKFWFGLQNSNAADRFGVQGQEPSYIEYYFNEDNLEEVQTELKSIEETLGKYLPLLETWYNDEATTQGIEEHLKVYDKEKLQRMIGEYADYKLGKQIEKSIIEMGQCYFNAEL